MTLGRLLVRLQIPIINTPLMFHRWLPIGQENGIHDDRANYHLVLWFNLTCINRTDRLEAMQTIEAHTIYADVTTDNLEDRLLDYMRVRDYTRMPTPEEEPLAQDYEEHSREVFTLVRDGLNHLLAYVRIEKGQYWLTPYVIDLDNTGSHAAEYKAQACIDDGSWFRWRPSQNVHIIISGPSADQPRYLTQEDWPHAQEFLTQGGRLNLTRQLLAGSEILAHLGYDRAALTEVISALEVALARFAESPKIDALVPNSLCERVGVESLKSLVGHLGLRASVDYLLPILFSEEQAPKDLLTHCRNAIQERQNVVHDGQRQVDPNRLKQFLNSVRTLCEILLQWTTIQQRSP
jgi:hypothetical protein